MQKSTIYSSIIIFICFLSGATVLAQREHVLPENFPEIQINVYDNPEEGYVFITPCGIWGSFPDATPYLVILDNYGTPVYYRELAYQAFDFKVQQDGSLSFWGGGVGFLNHIMDSAYDIIETSYISGYSGTDFHDFKILENGNHLLLGWEDRLVDMDTVVQGGHPGVTVGGALIQEKDTMGNIIWQWSSWNHFKILETDTTSVDLLSSTFIDYVHTNALFQDTDSTILISSRNMHEVTKINKNTGDLIWRMGGSKNEFSFIGDDTNAFSGQHDISRLDNGNYLLFDNGWYHPDIVSSALELELDEINKLATCIKRYRSEPEDILGVIMGSSQRLPGGNTLVGWGSGVPNVTEFKPDGTKALEFEFESVSYRAFKFDWHTSLLTCDSTELEYGDLFYGDSSNKTITLTNHYAEKIFITGMHGHTNKYILKTEMPLEIGPGSSAEVDILFIPEDIGIFDDILTIYAEKENPPLPESFAIQIDISGSASQHESIQQFFSSHISVYPNPTDGIINISMGTTNNMLEIILTNTLRQQIYYHLMPNRESQWNIDITNKESGIYILQLRDKESGQTASWKIIKN